MNAPLIICAVCGFPLDRFTDADGARFVHTPLALATLAKRGGVPHNPVPIEAPPGYAGGFCDFCSAQPPLFVLPARDFTFPDSPHQSSNGDWSACAACGELLAGGDWSGLVERAARAIERENAPIPPGYGRVLRESLTRTYARLRECVTGPLRPLIETSTEDET
jgi:hypothetical protein